MLLIKNKSSDWNSQNQCYEKLQVSSKLSKVNVCLNGVRPISNCFKQSINNNKYKNQYNLSDKCNFVSMFKQ